MTLDVLQTGAGGGGRAKTPLICFSHLRWDFVFQRPQHLLTRAARQYEVYFMEEPRFEPGATPHLARRQEPCGVRVLVPVLPQGSEDRSTAQQAHLLDGLISELGSGRPIVLWYYTPLAIAFSRHLQVSVVVYDNMDELSAFRGASPELLKREDELFSRADVVFTGGMSLYHAKRHRHPNVRAFPSSIDVAHFGAARKHASDPNDQREISRPRLGFFGVIDERMDLDLVKEMADQRPQWQFIFIGPVVKIDPNSLPQRSNIHWLGMKSYSELPSYLAGWNIGIMPFALNEATAFISPTKTLELLAAGLPVVSTPIRDVVSPYGDRGLVEIARTPSDFLAKCEGLLSAGRPEWLTTVDAWLAGGSWDQTWSSMHDAIEKTAQKKVVPLRRRHAGIANV